MSTLMSTPAYYQVPHKMAADAQLSEILQNCDDEEQFLLLEVKVADRHSFVLTGEGRGSHAPMYAQLFWRSTQERGLDFTTDYV